MNNRHIIISSNLRKVSLLSAIFFFGLFFSQCRKEGELSPAFEENTSLASFTDSLAILVTVEEEDSLGTTNISQSLLGTYKDSVFGTSTAAFYAQILLPGNSLDLGTEGSLVVDSIVLALRYDGHFGSLDDPRTVVVSELSEALIEDTDYYSDTVLNVEPMPLATHQFTPNTSDSVRIAEPDANGDIDTILLAPQLRIPLDNNLGQRILDESGGANLADNDAFTQFFKGIFVNPQQPMALDNLKNAILYLSLTDSDSKISLYYTDNGDQLKKKIDFPINSSSIRINIFNHDRSNTPIEAWNTNNMPDSSLAYSQAMAGVRTRIRFPDLAQLQANQVVINKAELEIPVVGGSYDTYGVARSLILIAADSSDQGTFLPDFFEGANYFGGEYVSSTNSYTFNIARYMHDIINGGRKDYGLFLLVSGSAINAERVVVATDKRATNPMKLNLYYSKTN